MPLHRGSRWMVETRLSDHSFSLGVYGLPVAHGMLRTIERDALIALVSGVAVLTDQQVKRRSSASTQRSLIRPKLIGFWPRWA